MRQLVRRLAILAVAVIASGTAMQAVTLPAATALPPICDVGEECGGGGGGGGGTPVPPFTPPQRPFIQAPMPTQLDYNPTAWYACEQVPHVWVGFGNDVPQGTTLYPTGVVVPGSRALFHFYNAAGQLAASHQTQPARANCVIHHEPEAMSTAGLAPGYYFVYASYVSMSPARIVPPDSLNGYGAAHTGRYVTVIRIR